MSRIPSDAVCFVAFKDMQCHLFAVHACLLQRFPFSHTVILKCKSHRRSENIMENMHNTHKEVPDIAYLLNIPS